MFKVQNSHSWKPEFRSTSAKSNQVVGSGTCSTTLKLRWLKLITSRERPKSALCLGLKKRNAFEICKMAFVKPLGFLKLQFVAKYEKIEGDPLETLKIFQKIENIEHCHSAENCKRGTLCFFNIHSVANYQTNNGGPLWRHRKTFDKKSLTKPKQAHPGTWFQYPKKTYSTKHLTLNWTLVLWIFWGKIYNATSELWKRLSKFMYVLDVIYVPRKRQKLSKKVYHCRKNLKTPRLPLGV